MINNAIYQQMKLIEHQHTLSNKRAYFQFLQFNGLLSNDYIQLMDKISKTKRQYYIKSFGFITLFVAQSVILSRRFGMNTRSSITYSSLFLLISYYYFYSGDKYGIKEYDRMVSVYKSNIEQYDKSRNILDLNKDFADLDSIQDPQMNSLLLELKEEKNKPYL